MRYADLKKSLENGERFSAYLVEGEEIYFRDMALETLKKALISEPSLNIATIDGKETGEILASLSAFPLLSERRMTIVKEFYPTAAALKGGLKDFLEKPNGTSVLVISNEKSADALKKFDSVQIVSCDKSDALTIAKWIKGTANASSVLISENVAKLLAEYCLCDMTRVKNETEKLIAYAGNGGEITEETLNLLVYRDAEYKIYEMTDHIAKKRFDAALTVIKDLMDKGETPQRIMTSVYNYFRRMLFVAISDKSAAETAALLGIKEFALKKTKEQASAFKVRSLKHAVDGFSDADYAIKSGRANADEQMWISLFSVMTER